VSTLFKSAAVFLAVAVLAEFIAGVRAEGWGALPILMGEVARAVVLTVLLWAGGDLVRLLLQIGKDLRAERVLLARIAHRTPALGAAITSPREIYLEGGLSAEADPESETGAVAPDGVLPVWGRGDEVSRGDADGGRRGEAAA
jgi:hypothetical protein